jgi:hypothetical protein
MFVLVSHLLSSGVENVSCFSSGNRSCPNSPMCSHSRDVFCPSETGTSVMQVPSVVYFQKSTLPNLI